MNRALFVPAVGCGLAFGATLALLHHAMAAGEAARDAGHPPAAETEPAPDVVRTTLEPLAAEYVRPWREYRQAAAPPWSRVVIRPVPSITTRVEVADEEMALPGSVLPATIHVTIIGVSTTSTPCIVDRETKEVRVFAGGRWQRPEDWLKTAPNPLAFRASSDTRDEATAPQPAQPTP